MSLTTCSRAWVSRPTTATNAPLKAMAAAVAAPIPLEPPVMTASLPARSGYRAWFAVIAAGLASVTSLISGGLAQIPRAFTEPDPVEGLRILVEIFCGFYATHRRTLRRLNALAALASTESQDQQNRSERRRQALTVLVGNIASSTQHGLNVDEAVATIQALTSFEFFDQIAQVPDDVAVRISGLVLSCLKSSAVR